MDLTRRELLILPAAAALSGSLPTAGGLAQTMTGPSTPLRAGAAVVPWARKIRRLGQLNMTEHDPIALDVEAWADYWASLKVDAVLVSVTGILAFYQTKVPFHRKGKYLGDRDFFGD